MDQLNDAYYAYPALRRFPIDSKESLESSYGAYSKIKGAFTAEQRSLVEGNFNKAAAYYGVELPKEPEKTSDRHKIMLKGASHDVEMDEIESEDDLNSAADFIIEKRASLKRRELAEAAKYVVYAASVMHKDLNTDRMRKVARIAGLGVGDRDEIWKAFMQRGIDMPMSEAGRKAFFKYANDLKELSDDDFYTENNMNAMCDAIDDMDFLYGNQHKRASYGYPEDVVFKDNMDALLEQANDIYTVDSIDTSLSKKATLERKDAVNRFFSEHFEGYKPLEDKELIEKVAKLDAATANALLEAIE